MFCHLKSRGKQYFSEGSDSEDCICQTQVWEQEAWEPCMLQLITFTRFYRHLPSQPRAPRHCARNHSNTGCKGYAWSQHSFVLCKARDDAFLSFLSIMKAWLMGGKCCSLFSFPRTVGMHVQILYISSDTSESRVLGTSGLECHWDEWRAAGSFPANT